MAEYTLPDLPYDYAALEPHISGRIMQLHHDKHHATYVAGANTALEKLAEAREKGAFDAINLLREEPRVQPRWAHQPLGVLEEPLPRRRGASRRGDRCGDRRVLRRLRGVPEALRRRRARHPGLRLGRPGLGLHRPEARRRADVRPAEQHRAGPRAGRHARHVGARLLPRLRQRQGRLRHGVVEHRQLGRRRRAPRPGHARRPRGSSSPSDARRRPLSLRTAAPHPRTTRQRRCPARAPALSSSCRPARRPAAFRTTGGGRARSGRSRGLDGPVRARGA